MATNLAIDTAAVEELMRLGGFTSKRAAVDHAVREAIAFRRQLQSCSVLGSIDFEPVLLPRWEPEESAGAGAAETADGD